MFDLLILLTNIQLTHLLLDKVNRMGNYIKYDLKNRQSLNKFY